MVYLSREESQRREQLGGLWVHINFLKILMELNSNVNQLLIRTAVTVLSQNR